MVNERSLTESNFLILAAKHYDSVFPDDEEFNEDVKRIVYVKRLLNGYLKTGRIKQRLLLNHIIILFNMFGPFAAKMLFLKLEGYEDLVKTILVFLNRMPDKIDNIGEAGRTIIRTEYTIDQRLLAALEKS